MPSLSRFKISTRLMAAFSVLLLCLVIVAAYSNHTATRLANDLMSTSNVGLVKVELASGLRANANLVARASRDLLLLDAAGALKRQRELLQKSLRESDASFERLARLPRSGSAEEALLAEAGQVRSQFVTAIGKYLHTLDNGSPDDARQVLLVELRPVLARYEERLQALGTEVSARARSNAVEGEASARMAARWNAGLTLMSIAFAGMLGVAVARSINRSVSEARDLAAAIAEGDLSRRVLPRGNDEVAQLLHAMNAMQARLTSVLAQVSENAQEVAQSSHEIAGGNAELSSRTERAASHLQQTVCAVDRIHGTLGQSTADAARAAEVAASTHAVARQGGEAVNALTSTMREIADSSQRVVDIISLIDGIAFQTNILALNAAVEAARAGSHGRGFAVVAGEVRALASRCATAAKEIKLLIEAANGKIETGSRLVVQTNERILHVVQQVDGLGGLIASMAASTREQASGVSSVNQSMSYIDTTTQQNAALVQELASTTESLKANAARLLGSVAYFRTARGTLHGANA